MRNLVLAFTVIIAMGVVRAQNQVPGSWIQIDLPFRPTAITTAGTTFWACGTGAGIAESADGQKWEIRQRPTTGGTLLLGISVTGDFGYAFGTGGTLLTTEDRGATWKSQQLGTDTILLASFVDSKHGLFRTSSSLFYVTDGEIKSIVLPKGVPADFHSAPALAMLSPAKAVVEVAQGWKSRAGFVSTNDGGASWTFYEPPHVVTYDLVRENDRYWAIGNETVGYDKPGGGYGVPAVLSSTDGVSWQHAAADPRPCHWQGCHACNASGCLASATLLVDPFGTTLRALTIPKGHLTAKWAATSDEICSVEGFLYCAPLTIAIDTTKAGESQPDTAYPPPLGTQSKGALLRCVSCALDPVYVDAKANGSVKIGLVLTVNADGTVSSVDVQNAPSDALKEHLRQQISAWLFEPPVKDGKPIRVNTKNDVSIMVVRPR